MKLATRLKPIINGWLARFDLELHTLKAANRERKRVQKLVDDGYFDKPIFPLLEGFSSFEAAPIVDGYAAFRVDCQRLLTPNGDQQRYNPVNDYFPPCDACIAYLVARIFKPRTWFEVGSGNSTRVVRQAISDGTLGTKLVCVDPDPRIDISSIADEVVRSEVQLLTAQSIVDRLDRSDVLFIDSSHELKAGGDVIHLLLHVVPKLRSGVIIHIHDVFLPYDYPRSWVDQYPTWNEQYVVQAMLQFGGRNLQVIWPGYYVHKQRPEFSAKLEFLRRGTPQSLWLRVLE